MDTFICTKPKKLPTKSTIRKSPETSKKKQKKQKKQQNNNNN